MKKASPLLLLLLLALNMSCEKPVELLIVTGGHAYDTTEFFEIFQAMEGINFDSVSHPDAMDLLASDQIDKFDVLLFYDFIPEMMLQDSGTFLQLTKRGKPMLFLHHSLCSFQEWEGYTEMVGGRYMMPGYQSDTTLLSDYKHDIDLNIEVINSDHPVTYGVDNFVIHDEGYSNIMMLPGVTPLLQTDHPNCAPLVGWVNTKDQSTIVYLMLGHDKHAYSNTSFQLLLNNSLLWLSNSKLKL